MYAQREPEASIDRYAGPYERWVFSDELGRPFAFPAIAGESSGYYTALLEGGQVPPADPGMTVRLPPLWNPLNTPLPVTPFAFHDATANAPRREVQADREVARLLNSVRTASRQRPGGISPRFRVNFPIDPEAWTPDYLESTAPNHWRAPCPAPKTIVAVIDDGLPFAHRAFLDSTGQTRVSHCWVQSGRAETQGHVPFGREYVNADIDALRDAAGDDDAQLYRAAGALAPGLDELGNHLRRHGTHGSHVMGLAAGNASLFPDHVMGDDIQIIAVQLPNTIAWDTSGFGKEMYMLSALHYVFERASRIAAHYGCGELPLVVNFSYGWSAGRHDGNSEMELAIQALLQDRQSLQPATALTMPTGNNFAADMHAAIPEAAICGNSFEIGWHLQPDDKTSSYLELWFPQGFDPTGYKVTMVPPHGLALDGTDCIDVTADPAAVDGSGGDPRRFVELEMGGANIGQLSADKHRGDRWRVMVALIPTAYVRGQSRRAPSGQWTLRLTRDPGAGNLGANQDIRIWLQRDDDPGDLKTQGRQSRLVDLQPGDARPHPLRQFKAGLGRIHGFGTLNGVASAPLTTRVSGYVHSTSKPCTYSSAGGVRQEADGSATPWGAQADVAAVADHSRLSAGIASIGVMSGARARLVGTSGAAPSVARLMALNAAAGRPLGDGFGAALVLAPTEPQTPAVSVQHAARTGPRTAPPIVKMG